ncbi:MAG: hypothetical protein KDD01_15875 [Phaeodactylibacter sp.]|nr:hypothetical protein [Phaeodactylibacter sp.]
MKNWQKAGIALFMCVALSGCKAWNCGCPMSGVNVDESPVVSCSLVAAPVDQDRVANTGQTNNCQQATDN